MKKIAILLTLIILITSVSYDSYAVDRPIDYNNYVYQLTTMNDLTYYFESSIELHLELDQYGEPYQLWIPSYSTTSVYVYSTNILNPDISFSTTNNNATYLRFRGLTMTPVFDGIIKELLYSNTPIRIKDTLEPYSIPPNYIPTPDEYLYITLPREGFKTIDKFMTYNVIYSIAAENINDVTLKINDENNVPFTEAPLIESFDALNHTATLENGYLKGQVQIWADYKQLVTGVVGVNISVLNTVTNRELKVARNVEIVPFTDADGDGIDDNTGEDQFYRPDIPGLDDLDLDLGTAVDTIRTVIPNINNGVANIVALLAVMFSWLPDQVTSLMFLIMILIAITTIVKILRG